MMKASINYFMTLGKRKQMILLLTADIVLGCLICFIALFKLGNNLTMQYQTQYYEQFEDNLESFSNIKSSTDTFCRDLKLTPYLLSFLEGSGRKDLERCLEQQNVYLAEDNLFISNSRGYSALLQLRNLVNANVNYSELILFNPRSDVSIAVTEGGRYGALCVSTKELEEFLGISGEIQDASDGKIFVAAPAEYASSRLYIVRSVGDGGLLLFCGLTDNAWMTSLLDDHETKNYNTQQICCRFSDNSWLYLKRQPKIQQIGIDPKLLDSDDTIQIYGEHTILHLKNDKLPISLFVIAQKDERSGIFNESWFACFLLMNLIWIGALAKNYLFVSNTTFKPLEKISQIVPALPETDNELKTIYQAIHEFKQTINKDEYLLRQEQQLLKNYYLVRLISGGDSCLTSNELELQRKVLDLSGNYVLMVVYPNDRRWFFDQDTDAENTSRKNITITMIQELIREQVPNLQIEFLHYQENLIMILPYYGEFAQEMSEKLKSCMEETEKSLHKHFCIGISDPRSDTRTLSQSYREALIRARLAEEKENGRTENIKVGRLLKQNINMADLIELGRYDEALLCFKEMFRSVLSQKSGYLLEQQLGALTDLTLCVLSETNRNNSAILEKMNIDPEALKDTGNIENILPQWENIFNTLEEFYKNKSEQKLGSKQFIEIYQYIEKNYSNPDLSLAMLAEIFHLSIPTLSREFKRNVGKGFLEYLHFKRIEAAEFEIKHSNLSLKEIAVAVGYRNTLTMTRAFKKYTGSTPGVLRQK